jgi:hypothetical protein
MSPVKTASRVDELVPALFPRHIDGDGVRGAGYYASMGTPYQTLDDVVDGFSRLEPAFRQQHDRRAIFLTLYGVVSSEMRERVASGAFADNAWVHRYAVAFANLYRTALEDYDAGRRAAVPKAWRLCFDTARRADGLVLQDMLLGINAHVNNDLPLALRTVSIDPDREARYRDHAAVNAVLGGVTERATQRLAGLYAPGFTSLDECAGQLDEMLSAFSLEVARESAWEGAVSLTNARTGGERNLVETLIGSRAAVVARLLLASTLDPAVRDICRRLEAGPQWLADAALLLAG